MDIGSLSLFEEINDKRSKSIAWLERNLVNPYEMSGINFWMDDYLINIMKLSRADYPEDRWVNLRNASRDYLKNLYSDIHQFDSEFDGEPVDDEDHDAVILNALQEGLEKLKDAPEMVDHPAHYNGKYECIDVMLDCFGVDAVRAFCILNAFKYLYRMGKKDAALQEAEKSRWYLDYYISTCTSKDEEK